jgi:hypothetical protein
MSIERKTLENNKNNNIFIETGTYKGETTRAASDVGFKEVHTIELQDRLYEESRENLSDLIDINKVFLHKGDSRIILGEILSKINETTTILLDAHIDGGNYIPGVTPEIRKCPLYEELNCIKNHSIKNHTIIIDDVRILGKIGWGTEVLLDVIISMIMEINKDYKISFDNGEIENDVLIAKI